ncbi:glycosyltransferase [Roseovarius sp. S4756]|uniref:glycosyltransferase n=1 Tax=Roseovarius maritimus TaxID=3342637 RepID=UPI00372C901C
MPNTTHGADRLMILMAVYNGAGSLDQQLDSLRRQTFDAWDLTVADDGSTDQSREVIADFAKSQAAHGNKVSLRAGPGRGFAENFLTLLADLPESTGAVALADQDDIWLPEKLERAQGSLAGRPADQPALYCSRRYIWSPESAGRRQVSQNYTRPPSFANALIENIAPGNTIVLNAAAARRARSAAQTRPEGIFAHDWWLYLVLTGMGAEVIFDPEPTLLYRQHTGNALGAGESTRTWIWNKAAVLRGVFARRITGNLQALTPIEPLLTAENRARLALFRQARSVSLPRRLRLLHRAGVYRQGRASGFGFWGAACLGLV